VQVRKRVETDAVLLDDLREPIVDFILISSAL